MKNKEEFYIARSATPFSEWVKLGYWNMDADDDPIKGGYIKDYSSLEEALLEINCSPMSYDAEVLVFSTKKPYALLRRVKKNGDVVNT